MNPKWFGGITSFDANEITQELNKAGECFFEKGPIRGYDHSIDIFELVKK